MNSAPLKAEIHAEPTLRLVTSVDEVASLDAVWQALLARSECHPVFSSHAWYMAAITCFVDVSPRVLVLSQQGEVCGIAPLVWDAGTEHLRLASDLADYQDFIVPADSLDLARQLLDTILTSGAGISASETRRLHLAGLRQNAVVTRLMGKAITRNLAQQECWYADLSAGYDAFLATRSSNFRYNLRRAQRRAERSDVRVGESRPDQLAPEQLPELFLRLHLQRFPDKLFSRAEPQAFCRALLPGLFTRGLLRAFVIKQRSTTVGLHLTVQGRHSLAIWNGGFDASIATLSPGKLLLDYQFKTVCRERLIAYDFLRGDESYKRSWSTHHVKIGGFDYATLATGR
ncbi:hypothetical protein GCM10008090_12180 [Arenicella chitinivorans]|uniref:BioF2-like acetyltransferase domain-containing protein n=1 Tax=Arenicella chitinivorans TaxID=1329800 RepID=A0A918RNZ3_9GAMM|nr:GNAT family N-acetyltransferase [Arenicella chitinivorans]GHA04385.1 hypothetical protein GCM10008090_12180 [Arenicella chitinivorans]